MAGPERIKHGKREFISASSTRACRAATSDLDWRSSSVRSAMAPSRSSTWRSRSMTRSLSRSICVDSVSRNSCRSREIDVLIRFSRSSMAASTISRTLILLPAEDGLRPVTELESPLRPRLPGGAGSPDSDRPRF